MAKPLGDGRQVIGTGWIAAELFERNAQYGDNEVRKQWTELPIVLQYSAAGYAGSCSSVRRSLRAARGVNRVVMPLSRKDFPKRA